MKNNIKLYTLGLIAVFFLFTAGCENNLKQVDVEKPGLVTVDSRSVSDEEVYYFLYASAYTLERYLTNMDWEDEVGGISIPEYIRTDAVDTIRLYHAINKRAENLECGLTDEQRAELEASRKEEADYFGGEEAFVNQLKAEGLTVELYDYFNETMMLYSNIKEALYGENGANLPTPEQIDAYIEDKEYICVSHILLMTSDEYGEPLAEEEIEHRRELAGEILARAESGEDFFSLLEEFGEDPGVSDEPHYYNMRPGNMVEEFEKAAYTLKEDEISGIVETDYGFHIIKRLPIEPESLMEVYCEDAFSKLLDEWGKEISYSTSEEFNNLDVKDFYENFWNNLIENAPDPDMP